MTQVFVKGQNAPLAAQQLRIMVEASVAVDLSALLLLESGRVRSDGDFVFYNQPAAAGVQWLTGGTGGSQRIEVDLAGVPADVSRIIAVVSPDDRTMQFGTGPAPVARIIEATGAELGTFTIGGLSEERAVIAWELYRRAGAWKIRAVGQGYSGGLAQLVAAHGVDVEADEPPPAPTSFSASTGQPVQHFASSTGQGVSTAPSGSPRPPAQPAPDQEIGGPADERLYQQVWAIFQDAARSTSALRSAVGYAEQRRDNEIGDLLNDPRMRNSPETAAARAAADRRHDDLVGRAEADRRRDVAQLAAELATLSGTLPAPMAGWDSPRWRDWRLPETMTVGIRVGDVHVPESPELRIPLLFRLPLMRALWIDSTGADRTAAVAMARSVVVRLLAAHPAGELSVAVADLAGAGAAARALDLGGAPGGLLSTPVATTPQQLGEMLENLVERVDLVHMAIRSGALDLPDSIDGGRRLLVLHDFPFGFDERSLAHLHYLLNEGPAAGVHLLLVADPSDSSTLGPLVGAVWRSMARLPVQSGDHMGDPWVGLTWTFTPDVTTGNAAVEEILARLARQAGGQ